MLAARHREDHRRTGANGAVEGVVGGGVAGVEADDEVDAVERVVAGDVADLEPEAVGAERAGERLAVVDHIRLEVEPDDLDLAPMDDRQQVVEREREVRLAGAEVDDAERAFGGKRREHVLDELEEPVHLAELVVALRPHLALGRHHAELDEERHRHAVGQHALLDAVVPERRRSGRRRRPAQDLRLLPPPASTCQSASVDWSRPCRNSPSSSCTSRSAAGLRQQVLVASSGSPGAS